MSLPTLELYASHPVYAVTMWALLVCGALAFLALTFITAPYGRHGRGGWGPTLPTRWTWVLMEAPAPIAFAITLATTPRGLEPVPLVLGGLYIAHYTWRSFVFPFLLKVDGKREPVLIAALSGLFNSANGFVNAYAIGWLAPHLDASWLHGPVAWLGIALFAIGYRINHQSDAILRNLRRPGETGYRIPEGGLYPWVSSPNYLGELLEWTGFALAVSTAAGWVFVYFTAANLVPRAIANHAWYRSTFEDYPPERRVLLPGLW